MVAFQGIEGTCGWPYFSWAMKPKSQDRLQPGRMEFGGLLSPHEVYEFLGISKWTLWYWRKTRQGPRFYRIGKRLIRYRRSDVKAWLEFREVS